MALIVNYRCRPTEPERVDQGPELLRHRGVRWRAVVGVDRDPEAQAAGQQPDGVLGQRGAAPVWTFEDGHISSATPVPHERGQPSQLARAVLGDLYVVHDADPVPQPFGPAEPWMASQIDGSPNASRRGSSGGSSPAGCTGRAEVHGRRVARLGPGDVEADHAVVAVAHGQLGDVPAVAAVRMAVSSAPIVRAVPAEPAAKPSTTASTTSSRDRPPSVCSSGAKRTSA